MALEQQAIGAPLGLVCSSRCMCKVNFEGRSGLSADHDMMALKKHTTAKLIWSFLAANAAVVR